MGSRFILFRVDVDVARFRFRGAVVIDGYDCGGGLFVPDTPALEMKYYSLSLLFTYLLTYAYITCAVFLGNLERFGLVLGGGGGIWCYAYWGRK
ncbi:hypothetical protein F4775DRAFT_115842 [Biscogniauxia sp. FL1348]|nr:hypothetical protein F4775DRAFT_115842 [Biscogniauxia sp. FL1348]